MTTPQLNSQRLLLPYTGVLLECLDENRNPIAAATASGFIRVEAGRTWLYTAWHVVTGYDLFAPPPKQLSNRRFLRAHLQDAQERQHGVTAVGARQTCEIALYFDSDRKKPAWSQDANNVPDLTLNSIGIRRPQFYDAARIELPGDVRLSPLQIASHPTVPGGMLVPGDRCSVVGYPYGFSVSGNGQPLPVVLTRFIAATQLTMGIRPFGIFSPEFLLEDIAAPGMSGGPVFVERDDEIFFGGMYTGSRFPDFERKSANPHTALGLGTDLTMLFNGAFPFAPHAPITVPSE